MCLVINQLEPKIADKDIVCYKVVKRTEIKDVYKSSTIGFKYTIGQSYSNNIDIKFVDKIIKKRILYSHSCLNIYIIKEGMFHSYTSDYIPNYLSNYTLLKCIIPKEAYYYEGKFDTIPSYASSQIKILEEI